uniref:Uncharacterized protein n=1 Tax=Anguilla anguilla TaxID=7936 RepID=A0A0E9S9E5_ANGAN
MLILAHLAMQVEKIIKRACFCALCNLQSVLITRKGHH